MAGCTDPSFEKMLPAYELEMLSDDDRKRFEIHMLDCNYCFDKAKKLAQAMQIIIGDDDAKNVIGEIIKKSEASPGFGEKLLRWFWPETPHPFILKPAAIIGLLLILLAFPVYRIAIDSGGHVQNLDLFPLRGVEQGNLSLKEGGKAIINFIYDDAEPGKSYRIIIESDNGNAVFIDENYSEFNKNGLGSIILPTKIFEKGDYILSIMDTSSGGKGIKQIYRFTVE